MAHSPEAVARDIGKLAAQPIDQSKGMLYSYYAGEGVMPMRCITHGTEPKSCKGGTRASSRTFSKAVLSEAQLGWQPAPPALEPCIVGGKLAKQHE